MIKCFFLLLYNSVSVIGREAFAENLTYVLNMVDESKWGPNVYKLAITVASFHSLQERLARVKAEQLTKATLNFIIDTTQAVTHLFALEKSAMFKATPKIIAFIKFRGYCTLNSIY
jgi:hypothetical protein